MIIKKAEFYKSFLEMKDLPRTDYPEIGLLGRSNVGKSSFINAITNNHKLARTSKTPGKTITINFYLINDSIFFVDLPGYGFSMRDKRLNIDFSKKTDEYVNNSRNLCGFVLIVDSRVVTKDDLLMNEYLKSRNANYLVVLSKIDKLKRNDVRKRMFETAKTLDVDMKQVVTYSSLTHENESTLLIKLEELIK